MQLLNTLYVTTPESWLRLDNEIAGSVTSEKPLAPSHGRPKAFTAVNRPLNHCNRADQLEEDRQVTMQSKNTDEEGLHGQAG